MPAIPQNRGSQFTNRSQSSLSRQQDYLCCCSRFPGGTGRGQKDRFPPPFLQTPRIHFMSRLKSIQALPWQKPYFLCQLHATQTSHTLGCSPKFPTSTLQCHCSQQKRPFLVNSRSSAHLWGSSHPKNMNFSDPFRRQDLSTLLGQHLPSAGRSTAPG